jgi:hypothetical protein
MFYPNSPVPSSYGAVRLPVAYEDNSFGGGGTPVAFWDSLSDQALPTQARVNSVLSGYEGYSGIICLDVERWNNWGNGGVPAGRMALQKYLDLLHMCRVTCPNARFSYYNMGPTVYSDTYGAAPTNAAALAGIRAQNDLFAPLTAAQDVLFPAAYTVSLSTQDWLPYVQVGIQECIRLAADKPRYPFLCPTFIGIRGSEDVNVDAQFFRSQMEFCIANADGFALWGGNIHNININFESEWWREIIAVVSRLSRRPRAPTGLRVK